MKKFYNIGTPTMMHLMELWIYIKIRISQHDYQAHTYIQFSSTLLNEITRVIRFFHHKIIKTCTKKTDLSSRHK